MSFLAGGGEMGRRMREHDWAQSELGPVEDWPQSLRSALGICLGSRFPIAIYWGPRLALLYNDAWSSIPGDKHPWALGRAAREVWPEIWDTIGPLFEQVMSRGEATYAEDSLLPMHRHGYTEECYFNFTFTPIRGDDNRVAGVFNAVIETTFRVITERRTRVLRELAERTAAARSTAEACELAARCLAEAAHDVPFCAIYLVDDHGARLAAAAGAAAPVDGAGPWPLGEVRRTGQTRVLTGLRGRLELPGGPWPEAADAAIVAPIVRGAAARPSEILVLGASPRRAVDEEYRQFAERAAAQLGAVLGSAGAYEEERRRAEALAEIDRAKTAFFSNISHEFRTPLTLMLGPQEDALRSPGGALSGESLRAVHRNTLRLLKLVNALLDFSRIESGRARAALEPTDLATLTADLASVFRSTIERAGLRYEVSCPPLSRPVGIDRAMWEKIVFNLLSNAFKFTFEGSIRVALREADDRIELVVEDTGAGIPEHELPRVFERFHRIDGTRARTHEGSGIGLALVADLVHVHGGTIDVASTVGKGTTFRVRVPARPAASASPRPLAAPHAAPYVAEAERWLPGPPGAPEPEPAAAAGRVLVADDNADMRDYLARLLRPSFAVEAVADGAQALAAARARRPDVILTDVMMPGLDGFALIGALAADPATAGIPVIMLSARAGEEARVEGLAAGAADYLVKPFSARELVARVEIQLQASRRRTAAETARARLYALFEQAPLAITVYEGPTLRIAAQNALSRKAAFRPGSLGRPFAEVYPDLAGTPLHRGLERVFRTGQPEVVHEAALPPTLAGGQAYYTTTRQALREDDGTIFGVVGIAFDVTEQVLSRRRLEVQTRVAEEARVRAEEATRAKDEFLAMLGHELRNPLAPIVTALQLARMRGEESRELASIERQVKQLVRLVDDLLDVSRITRGRIELRKRRIELAPVVARGLEIASPLLEERRQQVEVRVPGEGLAVDGDGDRLAQVVSNLVANAAKYSDVGSGIVVTGERDGEVARLRVRDRGIGIPAELLDKIFDIFVQQPQALDRSLGGLGLGLTIVRSLVELHGGAVRAESAGPGHGSELVVELPLAAGAGAPAERSTPPAPPPALRAGARRVLVVDDNHDAAELLAEVLAALGHQVAVAHDGPSALSAAGAFRPEVCLLDIGLPVMDGYEVARRLRAAGDGNGPLHLVAITGYGQAADRRRALESGFDDHLVKPVDIERLARLISGSARPGS